MVVPADKGLGYVFSGTINNLVVCIFRNLADKFNFAGYALMNKDIRSSEFEGFGMDVGAVFEEYRHRIYDLRGTIYDWDLRFIWEDLRFNRYDLRFTRYDWGNMNYKNKYIR